MKFIEVRITLIAVLLIGYNSFSYSQNVDSQIENCKKALMEQRYSDVLDECDKLLSTDLDSSNTALVYTFAGMAAKQQGDAQKALDNLKKSIDYNIQQYDIYETYIALSSELGDDDNYEYGLIREKAVFPDLGYLVEPKLVNHYVKTKQYEKLIEASENILKSDPTNADYQYYIGYAHQNLGDRDKAESAYLEALKVDPDHLNSNMGLAILFYKQASSEYTSQKKKYEKISNPSRLDYDKYKKSLAHSKTIYNKAIPYALKAYDIKPSNNMKGILYASYMRVGDKANAEKYK